MRIFISGASRGIGLEFVRQYLARGEEVIAAARQPEAERELASLAHRHPGHLRLVVLDVSQEESALRAADQVAAPVDLLINNAGIKDEAADLAAMDFGEVARLYDVNALGPLRVTRALLPWLRQGPGKKVVHLGSNLGSIGDNASGGLYGYRMAKAALNMASCCLAHELRPAGILSAVLSPGWVRTDMGGPSAPLTVEQSVSGMVQVIDRLTLRDSGGFFQHKGESVPW